MNTVTHRINQSCLTLGLGLVIGLGAMPSASAFNPDHLNQLLTTNMCESCDLSGAILIGADLYTADLLFADLSGAILDGADMRFSLLFGANLSGADLFFTRLRGADARQANLSYAFLHGADLFGANLFEANLTGATGVPSTSFSTIALNQDQNSIPLGTNFSNANLTGVIAIDTLFPNAVFTDGLLNESNFSGSDLGGADFRNAILTDGIFNNVNLLGATISADQIQSLASFSGTLPDGTVVGSVPEPSSLFGLGAMLVLGLGSVWKRKI